MQNNTKKIIRINASALRKASCMLRFKRTVIDGYRKELNDVAVEFGSAIHVFPRIMFETGGDFGAAMHAARKYFEHAKYNVNVKKKYLNTAYLFQVLPALWQWHQDKNDYDVLQTADGKPSVEITFSNKYFEDDNYIVYLEGTIDMLGKFKGQYGAYAIGDWKSTSSWSWLDYLTSYELSTQLRFYLFNLHLHVENNPDSFLAAITKLPIGVFINGIFLNGADKYGFERSPIYFIKSEELQEFKGLLDSFIKRLLASMNDDSREGLINGSCYGAFGKCEFFSVCNQPGNVAREHVLKSNFKQAEYTPLRNSEDKV